MNTTRSIGVGASIVLAGFLAGCAANPPANAPASPPAQKQDAAAAQVPVHRLPSRPPFKPMMTVEEVKSAKLDGDIGVVHPSFNLFPWRQFDAGDPRPQGFAIASLYLISNKTDKGVFADGTIVVKMFRVDRQPDGREVRAALHTWQFNPEQAKPYRSHRRTVFGEGYGLILQWPNDLDVLNKEIMVQVEFVRPDGKTISSKPTFFKVPAKVNG